MVEKIFNIKWLFVWGKSNFVTIKLMNKSFLIVYFKVHMEFKTAQNIFNEIFICVKCVYEENYAILLTHPKGNHDIYLNKLSQNDFTFK